MLRSFHSFANVGVAASCVGIRRASRSLQMFNAESDFESARAALEPRRFRRQQDDAPSSHPPRTPRTQGHPSSESIPDAPLSSSASFSSRHVSSSRGENRFARPPHHRRWGNRCGVHDSSRHNHHSKQQRAEDRFEQRRLRDEFVATLDGGLPVRFRAVDAAAVVNDSREWVKQFLVQRGESRTVEPVTIPCPHDDEDNSGNKKLAIMVFRIGDRRVQAVGKASRKTTAEALCYMHAVELIEHYTAVGQGNRSSERQAAHRATPTPGHQLSKAGECAEAGGTDGGEEDPDEEEPLPLMIRETVGALQFGLKPPVAPTFPPPPAVLRNARAQDEGHSLQTWNKYCDEVRDYLRHRSELKKAAHYQAYRIPTDLEEYPPVHNLAAVRLATQRGHVDTSAVQRFHNTFQRAVAGEGNAVGGGSGQPNPHTPDFSFARVYGATIASVLLSPNDGPLFAIGVGRNNQDAKARCCMHALEIISIRETMLRESGGTLSDRPPLFDAIRFLSSAQAKVLEAYLLLTGARPESTFRRITAAGRSPQFVCDFRVGDLQCQGTGFNRFEAERAAAVVAMEELSGLDPVFAGVSRFVEQFGESFDVKTLQRLHLSDSLHAQTRKWITSCTNLLQRNGTELGQLDDLAAQLPPLLARLSQNPAEAATTASSAGGDDLGCTGVAVTGASLENHPVDVSTTIAVPVESSISPPVNPTLSPIFRRSSQSSQVLQEHLEALRQNERYLRLYHPRRSTLAMASVEQQIVQTVAGNRVTVICGTTGCGKSTQVPQYLLDHEIRQGRGDLCNIVVTQPRRLSAFSISERIANERLQSVGGHVGYSIRLESKPGSHITLCTTGILLNMFLSDPALLSVTHLIIDEVHERDINCDVAIALAKEALQLNPSLRVVLMSATLDAEKFSSYFGGAPIIQVDGQTFPVQEVHLDDLVKTAQIIGHPRRWIDQYYREKDAMDFRNRNGISIARASSPTIDYDLVAYGVEYAIDAFGGIQGFCNKSVLVFLPGWKELLAARDAIERTVTHRCHFILLHSSVESTKQKECFQPAPSGFLKVILATNIAESGVTIDDAAVVIDTGVIKLSSDSLVVRQPSMSWTDPASRSGLMPTDEAPATSGGQQAGNTEQSATQLSLIYASRANGTQRRGRAGRTQGGLCIRLFPKALWESLPPFLTPEILRVPLDQVVLRFLAMGYSDPQTTLSKFIDAPDPQAVQRAIETLRALDAIREASATAPSCSGSSCALVSPHATALVDTKKTVVHHHNKQTKRMTLTPLGTYLSQLPCEPRIGKMLVLGALLKCLDTTLTLAAATDVAPFVARRDVAREVRKKRFLFARRSQSDHIALVNAYNSFVATNGSREYANDHYLHYNNLVLISKYKKQFHEILFSVGLAPNPAENTLPSADHRSSSQAKRRANSAWYVDRSSASQEWNDVPLVKACMTACLYPNVAILAPDDSGSSNEASAKRRRISKKQLALQIRNGITLSPSRESACRRPDRPFAGNAADSPVSREGGGTATAGRQAAVDPNESDEVWEIDLAHHFVYQGVFKVQEAKQMFLTNVSSVSLWALLLFAVPVDAIQYDEQLSLCVLGGWISFAATRSTLNTVLAVKKMLECSLAFTYQHPTHPDSQECLSLVQRLCRLLLSAPVELVAQSRVVTSDNGGAANGIVAPWDTQEALASAEREAMKHDAGLDDEEW